MFNVQLCSRFTGKLWLVDVDQYLENIKKPTNPFSGTNTGFCDSHPRRYLTSLKTARAVVKRFNSLPPGNPVIHNHSNPRILYVRS
jgi:hypothetical protein